MSVFFLEVRILVLGDNKQVLKTAVGYRWSQAFTKRSKKLFTITLL